MHLGNPATGLAHMFAFLSLISKANMYIRTIPESVPEELRLNFSLDEYITY